MKKVLFVVFAALATLSPAFAGDMKMPPSALTSERPNSEFPVTVAYFDVVRPGAMGKNPFVLTKGELVSNRRDISSMDNDGSLKICTVQSRANPVLSPNPTCVTAERSSAEVRVARFEVGSNIPFTKPYFVPRESFRRGKVALPPKGIKVLQCEIDSNGKNKNVCMPAG